MYKCPNVRQTEVLCSLGSVFPRAGKAPLPTFPCDPYGGQKVPPASWQLHTGTSCGMVFLQADSSSLGFPIPRIYGYNRPRLLILSVHLFYLCLILWKSFGAVVIGNFVGA